MTSVAIVKSEFGKYALGFELRPGNQPQPLSALGEQSGRPGIGMVWVAFALPVIGIHLVMGLPAGGSPELCKRVEFKGKTRMPGGHDAVSGELGVCAEMAGQTKSAALRHILSCRHTG